jgi:heme o synthase
VTTHYEPTYREDAVVSISAPSRRSTGWRLVADLVALTKPRVTAMVVVTMLGGAWLAAHHMDASSAAPSLAHLAAAVIGTAVVVGSANALNMYLERDSDGLMARTKNRPLPTGRLHPMVALAFGLVLGAISVPALLLVNTITGALAAAALVSYVCIYTPLKRKTPASLLIGAVPGAIPPLLGWTAVTGRVEWPGVLLFAILFIWQIPHFLAIATFRRDDYTRAGLKVLPAVRGDRVTRLHIVAYLGALVSASILLVFTGVGGTLYLASAIFLGAMFFAQGALGLRASSGVRWARRLFVVSIVYLVLLFAALALSP